MALPDFRSDTLKEGPGSGLGNTSKAVAHVARWRGGAVARWRSGVVTTNEPILNHACCGVSGEAQTPTTCEDREHKQIGQHSELSGKFCDVGAIYLHTVELLSQAL